MDSYLMMLYVTLDQESALKTFFSQQGWAFLKPDLSVITDKLGPVMSLSTQTPVPAQATCTFPAETDIFSTVPENTVHIVTETDSLSTVPENTVHIQLETVDQPEVKSRSSRKRNTKSDQTKPSSKFPRLKLQLENKSGSAELPEKEQSEPIVQLKNATCEPVFVDNVNRIIVKEEAVDSDYEPDNDDVDDNENTDTDMEESFKQTTEDNDASGSRNVTEGDGEQDDETGARAEERLTQKQRKIKSSPRGHYRSYDLKNLTDAYKAVVELGLPIQRAAKNFSVPITTLKDRVRGRVKLETQKSGPPPVFTPEQEAFLAGHLNTMEKVGYSYTRLETCNLATDYAIHLGLRDKDHPFGLQWLYSFYSRWPQLKSTKQANVSIAKDTSATATDIHSYFTEFNAFLTKYSLTDKPDRIFVVDEKSLISEHKTSKIIAGKYFQSQSNASGCGKTVTLIGSANAVGQQVPPYFVFPGQRLSDSVLKDGCSGVSGDVSETGWSNGKIFEKFAKEHLLKFLPVRSSDSVVLVLYDGHKSHVTLPLIDWAIKNDIILFVLPPNCSNLLNVLNISCLGPFNKWNSANQTFSQKSGSSVSRNDVCKVACKLYTSAMHPANVREVFKEAGIFPFDSSVLRLPN